MAETIFHGGQLDAAMARHGGRRCDWLDLSTGINPDPWPGSGPVPALPAESWQRLPDRGGEAALLAAARDTYAVPPGRDMLAANGTQALIELLPSMLGAGRVAVLAPCYREHVHVWRKAGSDVIELPREAQVLPGGVRVLTVVNPNNPDAAILPVERLKDLEGELAGRDGVLVVDEAFCDSMPEASFVPHMGDHAIVLKSFGKFFGLAGLRLGFAVGSPEWVARLRQRIGPWAVSGPALEIGRQAFEDRQWIEATRARLKRDSTVLAEVLGKNGLRVEGIHPLFVFARHERAAAIAEALAVRHVLVRPFDELPHHLRFGLCRDAAGLARLDAALSRVMAEVGHG
ncbi:MAG: threonine-phosphate decarboxylase [Nitratireductor sp.]|nr:threonine-phosphate decarboxylase [Nitratireductor sp.]